MSAPDALLENHTLVIRDGRILDILPSRLAEARYVAPIMMDRPDHLLMPGLVNGYTRIMPGEPRDANPEHLGDAALLRIAAMLKAGITCFCDVGYFPRESAGVAGIQGMRAVIGMPIGRTPSQWARDPDDYMSRALNFRDEFAGHPTIATAFAPLDACTLSDATFGRIATLANELDAGVVIALHESHDEVQQCVTRHGVRPIERLHSLGLLTPSLTAAHMVHVEETDLALAQRSGIAIALCPQTDLRCGFAIPPIEAWAKTGLRLGLGTGTVPGPAAPDPWHDLKLIALLSSVPAWDTLAAATCTGAAALGLDSEIGTLQTGKWADICCIDVRSPAMLVTTVPSALQLIFGGGRDLVTDVWVSGRQLIASGQFTRLDWPGLAARTENRHDLARI